MDVIPDDALVVRGGRNAPEMTRPKVYADFHNADPRGRVRLSCVGTVRDLEKQQITLSEGLRLVLTDDDELEAEGEVRFSDEERVWVAVVDWGAVKSTTKGLRHVAVAHRLFVCLLRGLPEGWHPRKEDPIELPGGPEAGAPSRPEPDVVVLRGPDGTFDARYPLPGDVAPVVEVASDPRVLKRDREGLARYAWNGVARVWVVNLGAGVIEVYTRPTGPVDDPVYAENLVKRPGDRIEVPLAGGDDLILDVAALLA